MLVEKFKERLAYFSLTLPKSVFFEEKKEGIRVASKKLMEVKIKGMRGFLAFSKQTQELTNSFILCFGALAKKRKLRVSKELALKLIKGEEVLVEKNDERVKKESGRFIVLFDSFPLCLAEIRDGRIKPLVSKGFKRG